MLNPCCCITPRIGTFIFGVIDLVAACSFLTSVISAILDHGVRHNSYIWGELALGAILLFMAILLLLGAYKNAAEKVRLWLVLWTIYLVVAIILIVLNGYSDSRINARGGASIGVVLIFIYQIWVVWAYLHELRYGPAGLTYCPAQVI